LAALAYSCEPLPDVALEFLNGPSQSMFWPMHRVMSLIGSAKGCKFRLTDRSVSAIHASLVRTPAGLWVVDLRGGQSITVNAVPVRSCYLGDGDILAIGRYRIRIRCRIRDQGWVNGSPDPGRALLAGRMPRQDRARDPHRPLLFPDQAARAITAEPAPGSPRAAAASLPVPIAALASGTEILCSTAAFPGSRDQPELTESVLVPLVNQFGMMQQQMFDQFQQAMGMLVQMFGTMHREQMQVIREELDRLHQLTEELQALKAELANQSRGSAQPSRELDGAAAGLDRQAATVSNASAARPTTAGRRSAQPLRWSEHDPGRRVIRGGSATLAGSRRTGTSAVPLGRFPHPRPHRARSRPHASINPSWARLPGRAQRGPRRFRPRCPRLAPSADRNPSARA